MSIYTSSKGEQKDTLNMATTYIKNALRIAREENNQDNINALEEELKLRGEEIDPSPSISMDDTNESSLSSEDVDDSETTEPEI